MKIKFSDGIVVEVKDCENKTRKEIYNEAKKVHKDFKDSQVKDDPQYFGTEKLKEISKKGKISLLKSKGGKEYLDEYFVVNGDKKEKLNAKNDKEAVKLFKEKFKTLVADSKTIKDAFNDNEREAMRRYLINEGELEKDQPLEDAFDGSLEDCLELVYWGTQYESAGAINVEDFQKGIIYEWCDNNIIENIVKEYIRANNYEEFYTMEEFDEIMDGYSPWDLAKTIFNSDYNPNHKYFKFRGDGNLQSFNYLEDELSQYKDDAIKWAIDSKQNIDCDMYETFENNKDTIVLLTYFVINELGY